MVETTSLIIRDGTDVRFRTDCDEHCEYLKDMIDGTDDVDIGTLKVLGEGTVQ